MNQVLALQMSAGNTAVANLLSTKPATQPTVARRVPAEMNVRAPSSVVQLAPKRKDQAANLAKLTQLRANADKQHALATSYSANSLATGDAVHAKLQVLSNTYTQAYGTFRAVLTKAEQDAQNQQFWTDIILGVTCGVAAGLAAAFVLPASASAMFSLTLAEAGTAGVSSLVQGGLSAGAAALLSKQLTVEGKAINTDGLHPAIQELAMWKKVAQIYRSGLEVSPIVEASHTLSGNLADRIGDLRVYQAGGKSDLTDPKIDSMMAGLTQQDAQLDQGRTDLALRTLDVVNLKTAAQQIPTDAPPIKMEREIWLMWMSGLPMNSNILDINAIEDHIGPKGLKIVDFGEWWTSRADQNYAIGDAVKQVEFMKAEASSSVVPADQAAKLRVLTL